MLRMNWSTHEVAVAGQSLLQQAPCSSLLHLLSLQRPLQAAEPRDTPRALDTFRFVFPLSWHSRVLAYLDRAHLPAKRNKRQAAYSPGQMQKVPMDALPVLCVPSGNMELLWGCLISCSQCTRPARKEAIFPGRQVRTQTAHTDGQLLVLCWLTMMLGEAAMVRDGLNLRQGGKLMI